MKKVIPGLALLLLMIIPCLAPAAEITDDSVARLLALSGLTKQVAELPGMVSAGFDQARQKNNSLPDAQFKEVRRSISKRVFS